VYEACGLIDHHETGFYPTDWHLHRNEELFLSQISLFGVTQALGSKPLPGDAFVFRYGRTYSHGGIYVGDDSDGHWQFIHSYLGRGVILSGIHEEPLIGRPYRHWSIFK
jgi:cell wall-associated NlpC family hydrolase